MGISVLLCVGLCSCTAPPAGHSAKSAARIPAAVQNTLTVPVTYGVQSVPQGSVSNICIITRGPVIPMPALAFTPDGKLLAVGGYEEVALWDLENAKLARRIGVGQLNQSVQALLFTKDNKFLLAADGAPRASGTVKQFELATGKMSGEFRGPKDVVYSLALSPDEKWLAAGSADKAAYIWDTANQQLATNLTDHSGWVQTVAFSSNGKLFATGGADRNLFVWETGTWKLRERLPQPEPVLGATFSPDAANLVWTVSGQDNRSLRIRKAADDSPPATGQTNSPPPPPRETRVIDTGLITPFKVAFAPDGNRIYLPCSDKTIRVYDARGGYQAAFTGHLDWVYSVAISADSKRLASSSADGTVRLWSIPENRLQATLIQLSPRADGWCIITPLGYFDTSTPAALQWKPAGTNATPEQLIALLQSSDAIKTALAGKPVATPAPRPTPPPTPPKEKQ